MIAGAVVELRLSFFSKKFNRPKRVEFFSYLRGDHINKPTKITNGDADVIRQHLLGQDKLIFDFSVETGLRISDVLKLKAHKVNKIISIKESKTKKYKTVEISHGLFSRMKELRTSDRNVYAFRSPRTLYKPLHRSTYHLHLKKVSKHTGINLSAHSARKLYAQNIFESTGDIFAVQKALNHKYITTTCDYLDIDLVELLKNVSKGAK